MGITPAGCYCETDVFSVLPSLANNACLLFRNNPRATSFQFSPTFSLNERVPTLVILYGELFCDVLVNV